ncbi:MAG: hypothetical protein QOH63_4196 [Acidobacteriota bacterium]|jgi:hypothetical protein|nr:hypothetical protein [Acidobacteriota bacterium]
MSKAMLVSCLVLAFVVELCGITIARGLGMSLFASVGVGLLPALILIYPAMRWWSRRRLSFAQWTMAVACIGVAAMLIRLMFG